MMTFRELLETAFFVNETDDGALLLRPRRGGRAGVLVMNEAARDVLERLRTEDALMTATLRAIGSARGREHYLIAHEGALVPSMAARMLVRDVAEASAAPSGGAWEVYS